MSKIKFLIFMSLVLALAALAPVVALAQLPPYADPGGVPHYFGPYGNWAFSPLPKGPVATITVVDGGTGYTSTPIVTIADAYGTGTGATADAVVDLVVGSSTFGQVTGFANLVGGTDYSAPVVIITGGGGTGALGDAVIGGTLTGGMLKFIDPLPGLYDPRSGVQAPAKSIPLAVPDIVTYPGSHYYEIALREFSESFHSSLPLTKMRGYVQINNGTNTYDTVTNPTGCVTAPPVPATSHLCTAADNNVVPAPIRFLGPTIVAQGRVHGIQAPNTPGPGDPVPVRIKFINQLPFGAPDPNTGLRPGDLFLPVDETVMGSGLGPALPGGAGDKYTQNRATIHLHGNSTVWISDGNVHQWITPANEQTPYPAGVSARNVPDMKDALNNIICDADPVNNPGLPGGSGCQTFFYTNTQSARLQFYHDHAMGITRLNVYAGEAAGYVMTDAVEQDMIKGTNVSGVNNLTATNSPLDPGQTNAKVLPGIGIPLVIQDRTFVDATTIWAQDPTWNSGTGPRDPATGKITGAVTGDLWYPHVYMTVQNPYDLTGTNAFGRWHYGPWFNPPTPTCVNGGPVGCIEVGPVPNEHCLPTPGVDCSASPGEPPFRPGLPNPSIPGESFLDTPIVNGAAYPFLDVPAAPVRFRILNAANDRMLNLQLYVAADKNFPTTAGTDYNVTPAALCDPLSANPSPGPVGNCTEVKMVPVSVAPANQYADTPSGIPDLTTAGPPWILIGTEGGFMPKPVVVPQQPIGYNLDPAYFSFGLVNQKSLFLGSAERADVVVDFTGQDGKTFILYNDSPAPVPAGASPYDFYTGSPNQMDAGGAPTTQPGYGPNTRTIMQIRVGAAPVPNPIPDVTLGNLQTVFAKAAGKRGVFEVSQDPIIMPQAAYSSAYNNPAFPSTATEQYVQIADTQKTFKPIDETGTIAQNAVTLPLEMKAMHDEMGGVYDTLFGRMSGMLGLSNPASPVHVLIPYGLASPPVDLVKGSLEGTPIGVMPDGTQIWRIFHNGVDTHTIHTHLFHTQLINRVDQSGQVTGGTLPVDPIEYGWKDTFRINPLEITYLAMRPTVPTPAQLPFEAPDSVRLIDPTLPEGATLIPPPPAGWFDPAGNQIEPEILNHYVNFGWEYVWHCHILSHEEMDMMHSLVFAVPPRAPTGLTAAWNGNANNPRITLNWTDNSTKEVGFTVQRATDANFTIGLTTLANVGASANTGGIVTFTDTTPATTTTYWYRVFANGPVVGDAQAYPNSIGFPTMSADSVSINPPFASASTGAPAGVPATPTNLTATLQAGPQVSLTWRDNATDESYFVVERSDNGGAFVQIATPGPRNNTGNVTYVDTTVTFGNSYSYQVAAVNSQSTIPYPYVTLASSVVVPAIPPAPTNFTISIGPKQGNNYPATLSWTYTPPAPDPLFNFTIQRATNATFTTGLSTFTDTATPFTQNVNRNTTYYYRIRANNSIGGSSAWTNALPFPIRTGP